MQERGITADLRLYDGRHMPYADGYFDYLIATSVLEHVSDPAVIIQEADRVLKPSGAFYLSFPNRFAPRETHTGFWFVSYLPRPLARAVLRLFGSNAVEELNLHFLSYGTLARLAHQTSLRIRFETETGSLMRRTAKRILSTLGIHHSMFLKTVMVVLEKPTV